LPTFLNLIPMGECPRLTNSSVHLQYWRSQIASPKKGKCATKLKSPGYPDSFIDFPGNCQ
jgi:hypothetical protein